MENNTVKNIFKATALTCLMAAATNAIAVGPTANVQVKGTVKIGACTPTLDNSGVVDYGDISTNSLSVIDDAPLEPKYLTLTVACNADTFLSWTTHDNNASGFTGSGMQVTSAGISDDLTIDFTNNNFNLGFSSTGKGLGVYAITFMYPSLSSNISDTTMIQRRDDSQAWTYSSSGVALDGVDDFREFTLSDKTTLAPVAFKNLTMQIKINANVDNSAVSSLSDVATINGDATINLNYL